jgi:hypothetical protein
MDLKIQISKFHCIVSSFTYPPPLPPPSQESCEIQPKKNECLIPSLVVTMNPPSCIAPQIHKSLFKITTTTISSLPRS